MVVARRPAARTAEPDRSPAPITAFRGDYRFLSNFSSSPIAFDFDFGEAGARTGVAKTVEHAYQALKAAGSVDFAAVLAATTAAKARELGRAVECRPNWDALRIAIMRALIKAKFDQHAELAARLHLTGDRDLVEGNTWGDKFWGAVETEQAAGAPIAAQFNGVKFVGENWLGKILMERRAVLRADRPEFDRRKLARGSER